MVVTDVGGVATVTIAGGGGTTPTHTSYCGISADEAFTAAEFLAGTSGTGNALAIPAYTGTRHVGFARPTSEGAITALYLYAQGSPNTQNQISAWTVETVELDIGGDPHYVVRSNNLLTGASGYTAVVEVA